MPFPRTGLFPATGLFPGDPDNIYLHSGTPLDGVDDFVGSGVEAEYVGDGVLAEAVLFDGVVD